MQLIRGVTPWQPPDTRSISHLGPIAVILHRHQYPGSTCKNINTLEARVKTIIYIGLSGIVHKQHCLIP